MIYQSNHHQASSAASPSSHRASKSPRSGGHRNFQGVGKQRVANSKRRGGAVINAISGNPQQNEFDNNKCRGRCRVQWSEKHVKEGLVLVQEAQLARVVKTGPITEHYEIDSKPFASGQWAKVYRCRSRSSGIVYAAKYSSRIRFNADCSAELRHEIALLSLCSQSFRVVRLHDVYETPKEIIMVMEYAPGGDLQTLIDRDLVPLEGDVVHFVRQLVEGLAYLHERNIAHLDIKPQNLVMMGSFPECDVKLCDFEISRVILEGTEVREILGTPDYVAPEILHYEPITLAADMWSLGVTTYVLLTGFSPFGGDTDQETFQNISLGEVDFPEELFKEVSTQAKDFVAKLLVLDPSARMTAKQCLRHEWLREAPTQASPHLRRYLSKSREVLLERVVSRENLRRAALLSRSNLSTDKIHNENLVDCVEFSHSEMCLSDRTIESRSSLADSEEFPSPAESQTSLLSSSSRASLACASQSCLLNKEQTQGLLSRAQSRSQANLNHRGLLSRIRSLHRIQSQMCLSNGNSKMSNCESPVVSSSKSREKLYGLRSLSKSQGMLDVYRSLECLRRKKNSYEGTAAKPEDHKAQTSPTINNEEAQQDRDRNARLVENSKSSSDSRSDENLDSFKSVESDTLTEDSDELPLDRRIEDFKDSSRKSCSRQHSDLSSHSNNSVISDDKEDRSTESETDEPKYTVAQLVSAFNKHQEVASKTSLEAIMSERRINEVTFPTGTKALRLFIPDIDIMERTIVRRKTSYKPRKNWEELRKRNERNEGVLKRLENGTDDDDDDEEEEDSSHKNTNNNEKSLSANEWKLNTDDATFAENIDSNIDENYKRCVNDANKQQNYYHQQEKERLSNYVDSETSSCQTNKDLYYTRNTETNQKAESSKSRHDTINTNNVNLKDILQRVDNFQNSTKENMENLRRRTSITKIIVNDNLSHDNTDYSPNSQESGRKNLEQQQEQSEEGMKLLLSPPSFVRSSSLSSDSSCPTPSSVQSSWEDVQNPDKNQKKNEKEDTSSKQRLWGRVCTGSYTRAMEKFSGKGELLNNNNNRKVTNVSNVNIIPHTEKTRRKSDNNTASQLQCVNR